MSCGVGSRRSLDPALLWLWRSLSATALIRPLAWEPPYAMGLALEKAKRPKKKNCLFLSGTLLYNSTTATMLQVLLLVLILGWVLS